MLIYALCRQYARVAFTHFLSSNPPVCQFWQCINGVILRTPFMPIRHRLSRCIMPRKKLIRRLIMRRALSRLVHLLISQNLQICLCFFLHPANKPDFLTDCAKASTMSWEEPSFYGFYEETNYEFLCWEIMIRGFYHLFWKINFFLWNKKYEKGEDPPLPLTLEELFLVAVPLSRQRAEVTDFPAVFCIFVICYVCHETADK